MKTLWHIPDFLDLEYFFIQDRQLLEEEGEGALRDRDRDLYLAAIAEDLQGAEAERDYLVFRWLQERRSLENASQGGQALLPGRMWYELYGLFWSLFSFLALAIGGGLAYSFLSYSGEQPVNVSLFFLVFVVFQFLILLALLLLWGSRRIRGLDLSSSLLLSLVNRGLNSFLFKVRKQGLDSMDSGRRAQFGAALAAVRTRGKGYGSLFFWPLFLLFQLFGIAFNFGVLGALLIKVASSDLAFGWQSTIQLSSQFVARLVQWIALPWSWFLGPTSYPDLNQVEGSRMVLKDGFYHLASGDLVSWWPFLCLAICIYCLLPRIIFFIAGGVGRNRALARVSFSRSEHNQLIHRLLTPRLKTVSRKERKKPVPDGKMEAPAVEKAGGVPEKERGEESVPPSSETPVNGELQAFIPDEIFDDCEPEELQQLCHQAFGYGVGRRVRVDEEYGDGAVALGKVGQETDSPCPPLLVLQEAWQPPIQEMLSFLRDLRGACEQETHIIVALIGRPTTDSIFTPVSGMDLNIWQQKVASLEDPCLQVSPLVSGR